MAEPAKYAWIEPQRLAVAERPGGGGRTHRRERRESEMAWWRAQGVEAVVSGMRTRHGLVEYALDGFRIAWRPLRDPAQGPQELAELVAAVEAQLELGSGAVLVHVDYANEWLAAVDAALRLSSGRASTAEEALTQAAADGLPVGRLAEGLLTGTAEDVKEAAGAV